MITMLVIDDVSWWNIDADRTARRRAGRVCEDEIRMGAGCMGLRVRRRRRNLAAAAATTSAAPEIHYGKIISSAFRRARAFMLRFF